MNSGFWILPAALFAVFLFIAAGCQAEFSEVLDTIEFGE